LKTREKILTDAASNTGIHTMKPLCTQSYLRERVFDKGVFGSWISTFQVLVRSMVRMYMMNFTNMLSKFKVIKT